MSKTAREIRRRFNNSKVAEAIITRAADDFSIAFAQDDMLATLRDQLEVHSFPYPLLNHDEMALLQHDAWNELELDTAILVEFDTCSPGFTQRLKGFGMKLSVKTGKDVMGAFIVLDM